MNIKDSYIHGDQAVVRSIEGLSVSNDGNLVLKYKKADSDSTEETKSIAISSFNSALSNKFVTLDTTQTVSGKKTFSNGIVVQNGLLFDKGGTSASDDVFHIDGISSYAGKIYLTGASASNSANSTTQLVFQSGTTKGAAITSNGNNVIINPSESSTTGQIILQPGTGVTATKFIKNSSSTNILLANGEDIAQSTLTNAFTGTVSVTNTSDSPSKLQVTVGSKSGSTVVDYAKQAHDLYRTALTSGQDLNSLTDEGVYVTTSSAIINSLVNNPSGVTTGEYRLEVVQQNAESTGSYIIQNLTRTSGNAITNYQRSRTGGGTWSAWHIQYDDATLTKSVITNLIGTTTYAPYNSNGYLPLNGGTLTGNLTIKKSSSDIGTYVIKTDSSGNTIRQLLFGIGSSGVAGIYDYATSSWIVSIAKDSPYAATFNGNASTATALTTDAGSSKIPVYFSGGKPVSTGYDLSTFLTSTNAANTYLKLSGGMMTGSIGIKRNSTDGEARGLIAYGKNSNSISGGIGFLWGNSHEDEPYIFLATKTTEPWNSTNGLLITSSNITWKGNEMLTSSDVSGGGNSWGSSLTVDGKILTIPSNPNTDYQVKQSNKTDNVYYPILLGGNYNATASSIATADKTSQVYQNSGVYVNASTKTIYASTFSGSFSGNSTTSTQTKYTLTSSAYHLVGVNENLTSTATARSAIGRNDVLVTASGAIQAVDTAGFNLGTSATMKYNTTNKSIDFIFN